MTQPCLPAIPSLKNRTYWSDVLGKVKVQQSKLEDSGQQGERLQINPTQHGGAEPQDITQ